MLACHRSINEKFLTGSNKEVTVTSLYHNNCLLNVLLPCCVSSVIACLFCNVSLWKIDDYIRKKGRRERETTNIRNRIPSCHWACSVYNALHENPWKHMEMFMLRRCCGFHLLLVNAPFFCFFFACLYFFNDSDVEKDIRKKEKMMIGLVAGYIFNFFFFLSCIYFVFHGRFTEKLNREN